MVLFKQIHPNHINDSWLQEGFIAVKLPMTHGHQSPLHMAQVGQRFDLSPFYTLMLDSKLSVTDLGTRDQILLLSVNIFLLAISMNTTSLVAYYALFCQTLLTLFLLFPAFLLPFPPFGSFDSSHTRIIHPFGRWFRRRKIISFNISLVMFSANSYSICL